MKKIYASFAGIAATAAIILSFNVAPQSAITGKITPADAAEAVWAIGATDSVKSGISAGAFSMQVKPGTYKLVVDAKAPRKDVLLENIEVKGQPVDVGEIVVQ